MTGGAGFVGSHLCERLLDLAHSVLEITGSKSEIVYRPLPEDDPRQRQPDIRLAHERLGWTPSVDLQTGLNATVAYFQNLAVTGVIDLPGPKRFA